MPKFLKTKKYASNKAFHVLKPYPEENLQDRFTRILKKKLGLNE